jgi:hypothetical protein
MEDIGKKKTGTVFQGLSKFYKSKDSYASQDVEVLDTQILKTQDKDEYERVKLQKQQLHHIKSQWGKINNVVSQKMMNYESYRMISYYDYEMMSNSDIIGRVLELYAEEACTPNAKGKVLNIYSSNKRVARELHNLFYNKMNINQNLYMAFYTLVKLGDMFWHLNLDDEKGVVGIRQLPALEIERVEGDYMSKFYGGNTKRDDTVFRWRGEQTVTFKKWQVAHARLLLDETTYPYGSSVLKKVRKLYQDIALAIDSSLSEHLIRSVDRLIFKIDVGGLTNEEEIKQYLHDVMSRMKRKKVVDPRTGQVNLKQNYLAVDDDYFIPVRGAQDASSINKLEGTSEVKTGLIEFLEKRFVSALGVPKSLLDFGETVGDGKNLANLDVRFGRTVGRIQQAMINCLNEIAATHLYILGLEEHTDNFTLSLNNPSNQTEVMRVDLLQAKIGLFRDATSIDNGVAAMSFARAKREILNMTDNEIMEDIRQQRIDRAVNAELQNTSMIITNTGIFDEVDAIYANPSVNKDAIGLENNTTEDGAMGSGGGGGGGMGSLDMGGEGDIGGEDIGDESEDGGEQNTDENVEDTAPEGDIELGEGFNLEKYIEKLINEQI